MSKYFFIPPMARSMRSVRVTLITAVLCALVVIGRSAHATDPRVELTVANRGKIVIEIYQKDAPKTVAHFLKLVNKKFYDGILFHRVLKGFVAQCGDPASKKVDGSKIRDLNDNEVGDKYHLGNGGSGESIPFEVNNHVHERGTLAMALNSERSATGDSQFFINLVPNHPLDGNYCVFGKVVKGMDIVDKIRQGDKIVSIRIEEGAKSSDKKN